LSHCINLTHFAQPLKSQGDNDDDDDDDGDDDDDDNKHIPYAQHISPKKYPSKLNPPLICQCPIERERKRDVS
jgi:hypothetical protein